MSSGQGNKCPIVLESEVRFIDIVMVRVRISAGVSFRFRFRVRV